MEARGLRRRRPAPSAVKSPTIRVVAPLVVTLRSIHTVAEALPAYWSPVLETLVTSSLPFATSPSESEHWANTTENDVSLPENVTVPETRQGSDWTAPVTLGAEFAATTRRRVWEVIRPTTCWAGEPSGLHFHSDGHVGGARQRLPGRSGNGGGRDGIGVCRVDADGRGRSRQTRPTIAAAISSARDGGDGDEQRGRPVRDCAVAIQTSWR